MTLLGDARRWKPLRSPCISTSVGHARRLRSLRGPCLPSFVVQNGKVSIVSSLCVVDSLCLPMAQILVYGKLETSLHRHMTHFYTDQGIWSVSHQCFQPRRIPPIQMPPRRVYFDSKPHHLLIRLKVKCFSRCWEREAPPWWDANMEKMQMS